MPQVNLSDLSGPDLRRLLDATRGRGDAALSYTILQEMAARREGRGQRGRFLMRRRAEPHVVAVDLSDPLEREDDLPPMPHWRPPPPQAIAEPETPARAEVEPPPGPADRPSRRRKMEPRVNGEPVAVEPEVAVHGEAESPLKAEAGVQEPETPQDPAASQDWDLRLRNPAPRRAPRRGLVPGVMIGIAVGVGLGWWLGGIVRDVPSPLITPAAASVPAATSAAPVAAEFEPAAEAPPELAVEASQPAPDVPGSGPSAEAEVIRPPPEPAPSAETVGSAEAPQATAAPPSPAVARDACASEETPADRQICGDPQLRKLQRALRQAYAEALDAHQDRALLRERQLAWKSARDNVADPERLAALYEHRIRKLEAATAAARQQR